MAKIRVEAFKAGHFKTADMDRTILAQMQSFGKFALKDVQRVTQGWKGERPNWKEKYIFNEKVVALEIYLVDPESKGAKKWIWLDQGTKPHRIPKSGKANLSFMSKYSAGSRPGSLKTFSSSSGGVRVHAKFVKHPGIKARGWTELLVKQQQKGFTPWMQGALNKAAKASGHGQ